MAVTFVPYANMINPAGVHPRSRRNEVMVYGEITFDTSYPTNGESVTAAIINAGLAAHTGDGGAAEITTLKRVIPLGRGAALTHLAYWVNADAKLKLAVEDGTSGIVAEVANTTNVATVAIPVCCVCEVD